MWGFGGGLPFKIINNFNSPDRSFSLLFCVCFLKNVKGHFNTVSHLTRSQKEFCHGEKALSILQISGCERVS